MPFHIRKYFGCLLVIALLVSVPACGAFTGNRYDGPGEVVVEALPNPLPVPLVPRELVMDEVADEVDDYFRILREQRIRLVDNILTEGWIDTEPKIGSTILEPWRQDSTAGFELAHATLQTVRRWAKVRVIPSGSQYLVDVKVYKELEDLLEPENSTVSGQAFRHDNALDYSISEQLPSPPNKGWIPMGRDFSMEQQIVARIQERLLRIVEGNPGCVGQ